MEENKTFKMMVQGGNVKAVLDQSGLKKVFINITALHSCSIHVREIAFLFSQMLKSGGLCPNNFAIDLLLTHFTPL